MEEIMDYSERRIPFQDLMCRFTRVQDVEKAIEQTLPSKCTIKIEEGDTLVVHTPGGGGYGNPRRRAPKSVLRDVLNGLVSIEKAARAPSRSGTVW
jgi:N-methylhydantoinase B